MENKSNISEQKNSTNAKSAPNQFNKTPIISASKLKENGVHFGHKRRQWSPKMKPYIQFVRNDKHYLNIDITLSHLNFAFAVINNIAKKNGKFLFVGTKKEVKESIKQNAIRTNSFYINERWLGGTLTNFKTIRKSVYRLQELEKMQETNFDGYTKKEGIKLKKELNNLEKLLSGIKDMKHLPNAIFLASAYNEQTALKEAEKLNIPVFSIVDTNTNPERVKFIIPANDDASKSTSLIVTIIADAIALAKNEPVLAAYKKDEDVKILGVIEKPEISLINKSMQKPYVPQRPTRMNLSQELEDKKAQLSLDKQKTSNSETSAKSGLADFHTSAEQRKQAFRAQRDEHLNINKTSMSGFSSNLQSQIKKEQDLESKVSELRHRAEVIEKQANILNKKHNALESELKQERNTYKDHNTNNSQKLSANSNSANPTANINNVKSTPAKPSELRHQAEVMEKQAELLTKKHDQLESELNQEKKELASHQKESATSTTPATPAPKSPASYDIAMVKSLREATQAGFADCKKAVIETNGNFEEAIEWLKKKGIAKASKKANVVATEGAIGIAADQDFVAIAELNSQTDFVAMSDKFIAALNRYHKRNFS